MKLMFRETIDPMKQDDFTHVCSCLRLMSNKYL